jgi:hypothetical protein
MTRKFLGAVGLMALMLVAGDAVAQTRGLRPVHKHSGFWLSVGGGGGWEDFNGDFGTRGRGGSYYLRMGGTPNARLLFGGEALGWFNESDLNEFHRVNVMGTVLAYPSRSGGWFLKAGFGFASHEVFGRDQSGVGTNVGTGFDIRLGRNFYITPNVDYMAQFFDTSTVGTLLFTVGLTWH